MNDISLHLGCGLAHRTGWVNVDRYTAAAADVLADALRLPFAAGVAGAIAISLRPRRLNGPMIKEETMPIRPRLRVPRVRPPRRVVVVRRPGCRIFALLVLGGVLAAALLGFRLLRK